MGIIGMNNLLQATSAANLASVMQKVQTGLDNEKQNIEAGIKQDGFSTPSKDGRLAQISGQTAKISDYYSESIKTAEDQAAKSQENQNAETTDTQQDKQSGSISNDNQSSKNETVNKTDSDSNSKDLQDVNVTAENTDQKVDVIV